MSLSSKTIDPVLASTAPEIAPNSVDFPAPLEPIIVTKSPGSR